MDNMLPVFDYGSLNDDHKKAAEEIASLAEQHGMSMFADLVKTRFQVKEIPKYDISQSEFVKYCDKAGLHLGIQGFIREGGEPDIIQYPLMTLCDDVRKLEKLVEVIKEDR